MTVVRLIGVVLTAVTGTLSGSTIGVGATAGGDFTSGFAGLFFGGGAGLGLTSFRLLASRKKNQIV